MGFTCVVPGCKSNYYKNEQYVSVFQFPKDVELREKWINAIKRVKSFKVTANSRVCVKHFREDDIIRTTSFYDQRTGRTITASLQRPKLKSDAIPCYLFPGCPPHWSQLVPSTSRCENVVIKRERVEEEHIDFAIAESVEIKREPVEEEHILDFAIAESVESHENFLGNTSYQNFNEFLDCLQENEAFGSFNTWSIVRKNDCVMFLLIRNYNDSDTGPEISIAVTVQQNLNVNVFQHGIKQTGKIGQFVPGSRIDNIKVLETVLRMILFKFDLENRHLQERQR
ncbi:uncharacterized protein LOC135849919 [Planococcus citri]|uniref:uncharacterized protein LOC135849919 n=1 Tax=Planococcus citri TaxID=170843 RepID=UPI0031F7D2CE